jgi:hypothetical protein
MLQSDPDVKNAERKADQEGKLTAMTTNTPHQHTAKIYRVPVGGRASVGPRRLDTRPSLFRTPQTAPAVAVDGWYHEAAIADTKRTTEH